MFTLELESTTSLSSFLLSYLETFPNMFRDTHNQKRSTESPMDWEWQTQGGPTDPKSPFPQFKAPEGHRGRLPLSSSLSRIQERLSDINLAGFDSPQPKSSFMNASSTPAPQFRNPSFTTPRKPFDPELLSEVDTGAEDSPAVNADAEDTPDLPKQIQTMTVSSGTVRQPLFQRYGAGFLGSSPGQADRRRGKYANQIVNKVRKRKRIDRDYALVRSHRESSETDSDEDSRPRSRKGKSIKEESQPGYLASIFDYIESHPNLPNVLSFYAQLGVNMFIAGLTIFGIYTFWMTIQSDVDKASEDQRGIVLNEIALCAKNFVDNQCGSDRRVPALKEVCENWEHCMNRDPDRIGRARVSATTFAQIFNSFIEPISYKAMVSLFIF